MQDNTKTAVTEHRYLSLTIQSTAILEKPALTRLVKKFAAIYGNRTFIAMLQRTCHRTLPSAIHPAYTVTPSRSILTCLGFPHDLFPPNFL